MWPKKDLVFVKNCERRVHWTVPWSPDTLLTEVIATGNAVFIESTDRDVVAKGSNGEPLK